ncbi:MAG: hypothetical protein ABW174_16450 [Flavitalea sp.]
MKQYVLLLVGIIAIASISGCGNKNINDQGQADLEIITTQAVNKANLICNSPNPTISLKWLNEIIRKAEEDRVDMRHKGAYIGKIRSTSYGNEPIIYIKMLMGSGGLYAHVFNCAGERIMIPESDVTFIPKAEAGDVIYSNVP